MADVASEPTEADDRRAAQNEVLVELLARGFSFAAAGEEAGCNARTVSRRMQDPVFRDRVSRRRGERIAELTGQLADLGGAAIGVIRESLEAGESAARLRAAQMALSHVVRYHHTTEIEALSRKVLERLDDNQPAPPESSA